ncbi:DUF4188 domain-containing protein [Sulfitobacter sp. LCG007]
MADIIADRICARIEGDFVVFLIGARINKLWRVGSWLPVVRAMPLMVAELERLPAEETGFLGQTGLGLTSMVQYWRSFAHLEAYARADHRSHYPAWVAFNKRAKNARADVGIWHETYLVKAGQYETLYSGMPPHGLGRAADCLPATGNRSEARARLTG